MAAQLMASRAVLSSTELLIYCVLINKLLGRVGAVCVATGHWLDDRGVGVRVPVPSIIFTSTPPSPVLGLTQRPNQWVTAARSLGVKRLRREDEYSPPTSAEVKKTGTYTSPPPKRSS
jgi:hypothetical protein